MSDRPTLRVSSLARMGLIATSLVGSLAFGGGSLVAIAQDATPGASPAGNCVPGEMSMAMATPADMATPAAAEAPVGTPADDATTAAATAFVENAKACINDPNAIATLVTVNLVQSLGGYDSIEAAVADDFFSELPFGNAEIGAVQTYDDGSISVVLTMMATEYQISSERWHLVQDMGAWKLNAIDQGLPVSVDGDSTAVGINLNENEDGTYAIAPNTESVPATDVVILQAINTATNKEAHELVVVKLPEGADPAGIIDGTIKEEDVEFIGQVSVPVPGTSVDMTLVNLPVGTYTLLCFFPSPDGSPHAFHGMMAPFEITAPAE